MRLSDLFFGEHAGYYAEQTFGPIGYPTMLGSPAELVELLESLYRRVDALESRVKELEAKVDKQLLGQLTPKTPLDNIAGLRQRQKLDLLKRFGSIDQIRKASIEELRIVPGIGPVLAQRIKERLSR